MIRLIHILGNGLNKKIHLLDMTYETLSCDFTTKVLSREPDTYESSHPTGFPPVSR